MIDVLSILGNFVLSEMFDAHTLDMSRIKVMG